MIDPEDGGRGWNRFESWLTSDKAPTAGQPPEVKRVRDYGPEPPDQSGLDDEYDATQYALPLADCVPLAPVLAAIARGTKRSRLRLTAATCTNNHTLLEVFRGDNEALYVVYRERSTFSDRVFMTQALDTDLNANEREMHADNPIATAGCRCKQRWEIPWSGIQDALRAKRRRFVVGVSDD